MFNSALTFGQQQQSVFGQNNNMFAPKPFGTPTTPFGTQAAGSMFSGTSTGNFGGGTQAFSSPAFGNTASAPVSSFGTSTPAFGTSSLLPHSESMQTLRLPSTTPAFGTPTTPVFGSQPNTGFGSQPNSGFGIGSGGGFGNQGFGVTNAASTTAPFGSQLFNSGASPGLFGQPNSGFGNNPSTPAPSFQLAAKERAEPGLIPKLCHSDYYTEPRIQELAAKERAKPGFCGRVKDFIVGRNGFGSIKFAGETDVRNLDLESLVQFNNREVIVYLDDSKKPPVGQGLNKAAVVTLLNIKCFDKKTGQQCIEGVRVSKYKEMLMKKTVDQGAEFVSYEEYSLYLSTTQSVLYEAQNLMTFIKTLSNQSYLSK
ncbi:hypothetical protein MKW98_009947 [Papaver atlanticum]|uniref:Peptidase S59 domain-containing protein n=1 Tax=Papaver atlanticum TaxID=357466 RepID=A0AAD4XPX0_9MAGN|nr:hypothetical protein MKW98_009947 [Papaver atlanticum]